MLAAGRFRTANPSAERMTFHDPCSIVRKGGVIESPRRLMNLVNSDFVEMPDHGKWNWCCGGGGGVSANTDAEALRTRVFRRKKSQIEDTGATHLVTACANCRLVMEEALEEYNMELPIEGLTELVAKHLVEDRPAPGKPET